MTSVVLSATHRLSVVTGLIFSRRTSKPISFLTSQIQSTALSTMVSKENSHKDDTYYTLGITGSSGLLGKALVDELSTSKRNGMLKGKPLRIVKLIRTNDVGKEDSLEEKPITTLPWNPDAKDAKGAINSNALKQIDTIVHLAGENVGTGLLPGPFGYLGIQAWSKEKKDLILKSRVGPTRLLASAIAESDTSKTYIVASGVGVYGNHFHATDEPLPTPDESTDISNTPGFLAEVSRQWEDASKEAVRDGTSNRLVNIRFAPVLSKQGGALGKLYPIFFLGGGGIVGTGQQYFSYISARDAARAIIHCIENESLQGPVNAVAPTPATNAEFTAALGKAVGRPTIVPLPSFVVKLMFGEMGEEMLLGGVKAYPQKLLDSGFHFQCSTIQEAIDSAMKETI
jgi:uncharacterized protein (TIGR01777 family)